MTELSGKTALVVGGSRGFGRGIADALLAAGAAVHVVARNPEPLAELERAGRGRFAPPLPMPRIQRSAAGCSTR